MSVQGELRLELKSETGELARRMRARGIFGQGPALCSAFEKAQCYARSCSPVLITGETGTGKELCARFIHFEGPRSTHPFVPVNCSAVPPELFESMFFGHARGAYTGAHAAHAGFFEQAHGGTLFLDEINSLPLICQPKLLRAVQQGECCPLGETAIRHLDVRIISASNRDLNEEVKAGRFREDLYYRLSLLLQRLPPLREHKEDIPLLANERLRLLISKQKESSNGHGGTEFSFHHDTAFTATAMKKMMEHSWPGNVRELENQVERALIQSRGPEIDVHDLHIEVEPPTPSDESFQAQKKHLLDDFVSKKVSELLGKANGNATQAADLGKMDPRAFFRLMRKHQVTRARA